MDKTILQFFINHNGTYLLGNRYIPGITSDDRWEAILLSPDILPKYQVKDIGKMSFDDVTLFANEEIKTTIHLGKTYGPFQYGIHRNEFINLVEVTCNAMELVVRCYNEKISDYYRVLEIMNDMSEHILSKSQDA